MRVSSSVEAARAAVSGFADIETGGNGQQVSLGISNIAGMKAGVAASNRLLQDVSDLVSDAKAEADRVTALAMAIAERDSLDRASFG